MINRIRATEVRYLPDVKVYAVLIAIELDNNKVLTIPIVWAKSDIEAQTDAEQISALFGSLLENGLASANDLAEQEFFGQIRSLPVNDAFYNIKVPKSNV